MIRNMQMALLGQDTTDSSMRRATIWAPLLILGVSFLLWLISLLLVDQGDLKRMTDIGLLSVLPLSYYLALAVLIMSCCLVIFGQPHREKIIALHIILLILIIHATPAILYGTPRYSWTWKHLGIVEYIARHGGVDPTIEQLSAYHNWPGFFTMSLLLSQVAGLETPRLFAIWAPPFFDLIWLGALLIIVRSLTDERRLIWLSILFFYLANWVGQDYFSPQSLAYFLHLVVMGICLRWFRKNDVPEKSSLKQWLRFNWLTNLAHTVLRLSRMSDPPEIEASHFQRATLLVILLIVFTAIASSHQLTPFMTLWSVVLLVLAQRCSARSLPILLGVIAVVWIFYVAFAYLNPTVQSIIDSLGQTSNTRLIALDETSKGQQIVGFLGRGLTAGIVALGGLGTLRLMYLKQWKLSALVLVVTPFITLWTNSYGGEMIFRVYLFSLPFVTFLAAGFFYPKATSGHSPLIAILTIAVSAGMLTAFLFAYYGKENFYYFTPDEVEASQFLFDHAPDGSMIIEGTHNYPAQFQNYEKYTVVIVDREPIESSMRVVNNPLNTLERWMSNKAYPAAYVIITRSMKAEIAALGGKPFQSIPFGSLERIEQMMLNSPKFDVIFHNEDANIFMLAEGIRDGR